MTGRAFALVSQQVRTRLMRKDAVDIVVGYQETTGNYGRLVTWRICRAVAGYQKRQKTRMAELWKFPLLGQA